MKKLTILMASFILLAALGNSENLQVYGSKQTTPADPVRQAILTSDFDTFSQIATTIAPDSLDRYLTYAAGICNPYRRPLVGDNAKPVCQKENNAKIIQVLANMGAKSNKIQFFIDQGYSLFRAKTIVSDLKEWNSMAVPYVVAKIDKCLVALTQMQEADDKKPNYYVYADVWRNNNCSTSNYEISYDTISNSEERKVYPFIGTNKETVQKEFGATPTIYDHPSQYREVLTYKKTKERTDGIHYFIEEYDYIFTIDRGVVTKIQRIHVSSTDSTGQTKEIDQEKLKENQKQVQQHFTGKPKGKREGRMAIR